MEPNVSRDLCDCKRIWDTASNHKTEPQKVIRAPEPYTLNQTLNPAGGVHITGENGGLADWDKAAIQLLRSACFGLSRGKPKRRTEAKVERLGALGFRVIFPPTLQGRGSPCRVRLQGSRFRGLGSRAGLRQELSSTLNVLDLRSIERWI